MRSHFFCLLTLCVLISPVAHCQTIDKGHQILIDHGVQSFALAQKDNPFNISTVQAANFTGVMWIWGQYNNSLLGTAPGYPWGRWISDPARDGTGDMADMPPTSSPVNETPYMSNLIALSLGDEQDLNNATYRTNQANWYGAVRANYPNTILFCNNWGYQLSDSAMDAYITSSHPDMLSFDTYEWVSDPNSNPGGSPSYLYHSMRQVRAFGAAYGIPFQLYTQTYHSTGDGRRDPSDSELRLNYFAGVAFGFTSFLNFTYNTGATSLFTGPGDQNPTALYSTITDINAKLKKLSPALTRLKPRLKTNGSDSFDISMAFYPGQHMVSSTPTANAIPDGDFRVYPTDYSAYLAHNNPDWVSTSNSGMWRGITVTNTGTKNDGLRGDVWMMWFTPLDESFDGSTYTDQIYIMLLNGLSDRTGSAADCHQQVKLNLVNKTETSNLKVLNQQTGSIDTVAVPLDVVSGRRTPTFELDGGEMVLFKFDTGAPFVGFGSAVKNWEMF